MWSHACLDLCANRMCDAVPAPAATILHPSHIGSALCLVASVRNRVFPRQGVRNRDPGATSYQGEGERRPGLEPGRHLIRRTLEQEKKDPRASGASRIEGARSRGARRRGNDERDTA